MKDTIGDLINTAFINPEGSVNKMFVRYEHSVNVYGKPIDRIAIACQYVKTLFAIEHLEKDKPIEYYKNTSESRLENWIQANYKEVDVCTQFENYKRIRG